MFTNEGFELCNIVISDVNEDKKRCPYFYPSNDPYIEGPECLRVKTYVSNVSNCKLWNYILKKNDYAAPSSKGKDNRLSIC